MVVKTLSGNRVNTKFIVSVNVKEFGDKYLVEVETVIGNKRKIFVGDKEACEQYADDIAFEL